MEYESEFAKSFMSRTIEIAKDYKGPHDATLLINCLLGLLIVPKEVLMEGVPEVPFENWGIHPSSVKNFGKCDYGYEHKPSLRQLVRRLRNSVAHFKIEPIHINKEVTGFKFQDRNGFNAQITLEELHDFVIKLAEHLRDTA